MFNNTVTQINGGAAPNHSIDIPAGWNIEAGDLLCIFYSSGLSGAYVSAPPAGWTTGYEANNGNTVSGDINTISGVLLKTADGTEAGTSVTFQIKESSLNESAVFIVAHKKVWSAVEFGSFADNTNTSPNPPSLTPSWGEKETMFVAITHADDNVTMSAYPANYTDDQVEVNQSTVSEQSMIAISSRTITAASDDPGLATLSASAKWAANTMAILVEPPAPLTPSGLIEDEGVIVVGATVDFFSMPSALGAKTFVERVTTDAQGIATLDEANYVNTNGYQGWAAWLDVADSGTAESGTSTTLTDTDKAWTADQFAGDDLKFLLRITAGTNNGEERIITTNNATTLTVGRAFTAAIDATSVYEIVELKSGVTKYYPPQA